MSYGEGRGGGEDDTSNVAREEDVAMTGDVKTGHYSETWPGMGHWTGH